MKKAGLFAGLAATAAILCCPGTAVDAAQQAMRLWFEAVAPALFPILALMPLLTSPEACAAYESMFAPLMRPLFRLPGTAAPAMVIGMISGSPGGAMSLVRMAAETGMKKSELRRMAPVICGVGPAYLIAGVGAGLFGSRKMGVQLALIQLGVQLALLFAMRFVQDEGEEITISGEFAPEKGAVRGAVEAVLGVCGYMVLFSVIAAVAAQLLGGSAGKLILLAADLPSGMAMLAEWETGARNLLAGAAVGFGGICIAVQNLDVLRSLGVTWKDFFSVKLVQAGLCGALAGFILEKNTTEMTGAAATSKFYYALSLLAALILCLPVLNSLSKKLFLNKTEFGKISTH